MNEISPISGIHHITAVTSAASENLAFYESMLGLRLVKQTVNFDDPHTYHLYYGDADGRPGTILTFFPWERLPQGRPGAGMLTAVGFAIPAAAVDFWSQRLSAAGIAVRREERFGDPVLRFADPHGLPLELIGSDQPVACTPWTAALPEAQAIRGFHSATVTLHNLPAEDALLSHVMGLDLTARDGMRRRYTTVDRRAPGHFLDVLIDPQGPTGRSGSGTVHHIAFRTQDEASQRLWQARLRAAAYDVTPVIDRNYFKSIYFRTAGGVLFEIATDPPGFAHDEAPDALGRRLMLPAHYEPRREEILNRLPWLRARPVPHLYKSPDHLPDSGQTLVTLHGAGGSEHDLIALGSRVAPGMALLSPRGEVLENGMARFFRRLAPNRFDEADILNRARDLAAFLTESAARRGRDPLLLTALGYSNGANMAAAILLLQPRMFRAAILLRPMLPLEAPEMPDLRGKPVLILRGRFDEVIPAESTRRLSHLLRRAGAAVTSVEIDAGHAVAGEDIDTAADWLACVGQPRAECRPMQSEAFA